MLIPLISLNHWHCRFLSTFSVSLHLSYPEPLTDLPSSLFFPSPILDTPYSDRKFYLSFMSLLLQSSFFFFSFFLERKIIQVNVYSGELYPLIVIFLHLNFPSSVCDVIEDRYHLLDSSLQSTIFPVVYSTSLSSRSFVEGKTVWNLRSQLRWIPFITA